MTMNDTYLGDGVYASYDGYLIWLALRGEYYTHRIALEPDVLAAFDEFRAKLRDTPFVEEEEDSK